MNKRNFGLVIKRIEKDPSSWDQMNPPFWGLPFCFLGHARILFAPRSHKYGIRYNTKIRAALGLTPEEMQLVWGGNRTMADFKRWHKAGKVL